MMAASVLQVSFTEAPHMVAALQYVSIIDVNESQSSPCLNGGQCVDHLNHFDRINCAPGWNGPRCEISKYIYISRNFRNIGG